MPGLFVFLCRYAALAYKIRPESADAIQKLHENNIKLLPLTGDNA